MPQDVRVLHVDDRSDFAEMAAELVEREDDRITVETVQTPDEGFEVLVQNDYDCIVSDYEMPGKNGIEFLKDVRERYPDLPFILFTGKGSEEIASEAISMGVTDYLQKGPGSEKYELLAKRIQNAVRARRSADRLSRQEDLMRLTELAGDTGGWELDVETDELLLTDGACKLLNLSPETDISLEDGVGLYHPDDQSEVQAAVDRAVQNEEKVQGTSWRVQPENKKQRVLDVTITPIRSNGEVRMLRGAIRDVTERHERRQELEEYETIIKALTDAVYVLDEEGRFTYVNDEFVELVGYDRETILGSKPSLIKDKEHVEQAEKQLGRLLSSDGPEEVTFEVTIYPRDGDPIICEDHMSVLPYEGEEFDGSVGVLRDITKSKERKKELQKIKESLELAIDGANLGVWDWDMRTNKIECNDNRATMLGYSPDEVSPDVDEWGQLIHPDDVGIVERMLDEHIACKTPYYDTEHRMRTADGDWKWVRSVGSIFKRDEDGDPARAVGVQIDIDERKQAQRALREERDMFAQGPAVVFKWREEEGWPVEYVSDNVEDVFGYDPDTFKSGDISSMELIHEEDRERVANEVEANSDPGTDFFSHEPYRILTADGDYRWVLEYTKNIRNDGRITHRLGYLIDITERKEREEALERQNERLEEFASILSHDLRNPLNVAEGQVELAREGCETEHLDDAAEALEKIDSLIDHALTLAREGRVSQKEPVVLGGFANDCWFGVSRSEATLVSEADITVCVETTLFRQLMENLFRNTVEHGGEDVTVTVGELDDRNGFYVADDGPGIPDDERDQVFDRGYSTSEQGDGFGLGLFIVGDIAETHGWSVDVTESKDGGARFEFSDVELV